MVKLLEHSVELHNINYLLSKVIVVPLGSPSSILVTIFWRIQVSWLVQAAETYTRILAGVTGQEVCITTNQYRTGTAGPDVLGNSRLL